MNNVFRDRVRRLAYGTFAIVAASLIFVSISVGQGGTSGSIAGTVTDPNKAVVAGATVVIVNNATKQEFSVVTNDEGYFRVASVNSGTYTATVTGQGFKKTVVTDIKVDVGLPSTINVQLELGAASEQVTVVGGGELLRTETATVGTTLTGRQITDIPTASRDALDLVLAMPGTTTPGRPRTSSINGLPKGALNISIDGINVQDNLLKSSDGFFTYVRPRTDAVSEVTVSSSNPGAESSGEGAFQIKFVTQSGSNEYHGGAYWYHRNPALNANYWFSNRDSLPDPITHKAPQARILLNQPGFKVGGPISIPKLFNGKDKAFFFVNYEEFRLPEKTFRTRTILSTQAQAGTFRFFSSTFNPTNPRITCAGSGSTRMCSVNVYDLAADAGLINTPDPTVGAVLTSIRSSVAGQNITDLGNPNLQSVSFNNIGGQVRKFPTVRFDFNITKNHHIENIWNYQQFRSQVDFLNNVDPAFPDFPNFGSQDSNRFSNSTAWRWNITDKIVNEARFGLTGGTSLFFAQVNSGQFTNQGGYNLNMATPLGITNATVTSAPSRRNTPVKQFTENLNWVAGNHVINFGGDVTWVSAFSQNQTVVPQIIFFSTTSGQTTSSLDPTGFAAFSSLSGAGQQTAAAQLYYVLAGRLHGITANARLNEDTQQYKYLGDGIQRYKQTEAGFFAQDSWKLRPNLTVTGGLRYEMQGPFVGKNNVYSDVSYAGLFGESGEGNLFKPGTLAGSPSMYTAFGDGDKAYKTTGRLAPSVGVVYSPNFKNGFLRYLTGTAGQTVLRGGFSIATVREGTANFTAIVGSNPGATIDASRNLVLGNLTAGNYLRNGPFAPPNFPSSPAYPSRGLITDGVNAFKPDLKLGYVESWTVGIQREITQNMVFEARYVGNRGKDLWHQYDLNELNIIENGVFSEWKLAQQNLLANIQAHRCQTGVTSANCEINFAYFGPGSGTSPLPITLAYFSGLAGTSAGGDPSNAANYSNANFRSSTYYNTMNPFNFSPLTFGSNLSGTTFESRRTAAGQPCYGVASCTGLGLFPYNHFLVNAGKRGGSFLIDNSGESSYDAVTFELRRRMSNGLLTQFSYTFGKAISNMYASSSSVFDQPATLRDFSRRKSVTPFDITQAFKVNFIYELPVGRGKWLLHDAPGWVDQIVGGWGVNGNLRFQSGSPFSLGNVQLVGMTKKELQKAVGIYKGQPNALGVVTGDVYFLPLDIRQNTFRANNVSLTASGPSYTQGAPAGRYIAPAGLNCAQATTGECGFTNLVLKGPWFYRSDLSIVKRIRFTERINGELRGEFLNAFNNINFLVGNAGNDVNAIGGTGASTFARYTAAYQDLSTTNDPGGRLVQLVVRINF